jgi:hypothetical protein
VALLLAAAAASAVDGTAPRAIAEPSPASVPGSIAVPGLERALHIDRDRHGVPHVDAASERDAFFALGFCQAQDRLAQLLHLRRRARGTAAEQVGASAIEADRLARLLDFTGLAERQWKQLAPAARRTLEAYAAGVNARIATLSPDDRSDAQALRSAEDPWRPQDSLALYKLFAWSLSESIDASLVLNDLVAELGATDTVRFFPAQNADRPAATRATAAAAPWLSPGARALRGSFGLDGHGVGSTAFAVGGARTASGHPVLVADSHFEPTTPAALYLAHLRSPGQRRRGRHARGRPDLLVGTQRKLAWAAVNAGLVVTDLYTETLRGDGREYHDGRKWQRVEERVEQIHVRGGSDTPIAIRRTAHGPLLPSADPATSEAIAVSWTGARNAGGGGIAAMLAVARAGEGDAVVAALREHDEPPIALVWAEAAGGAGMQVAGWVPHRRLAAQLLPLPGRARWYDWEERVPFASLPAQRIDAGDGFAIAADQRFDAARRRRPDRRDLAHGRAHRPAARAARGSREAGPARIRGAARRRSPRSQRRARGYGALARGRAARGAGGERARAAPARVGRPGVGRQHRQLRLSRLPATCWPSSCSRRGSARSGSRATSRCLRSTSRALVAGVLDDAAAGGRDVWSEPDIVREAVRKSLREAWLALSFEHGPIRAAGPGARCIRSRSVRSRDGNAPLGPFAYGGAPHAVLAAGYSLARIRSRCRSPSTARFAVDTATLDIALTALAPGQSSARGRVAAGLDGWLAGRFALLATRRLEVEDLSVEKLVLEPLRSR